MREPPSGRFRSSASRRTGWVIGSQVLSSTSNFAIGIVVARAVSARDFGAFGIAMATYFFFTGALRAVVGEPLIVRFSGTSPDSGLAAANSAANAALGIGTGAGILLGLVSATVLHGAVAACMLALAVSLPGLSLQDGWRYGFFVLGRPRSAAINDAMWILFQIAAVGFVLLRGAGEASSLLLAWGLAGSLAGVCGFIQARPSRPALWRSWVWPIGHRDLGARFLGEFLTSIGTGQLCLYGLGLVSGLTAVAAVRGTLTLLGPTSILYTGVTITAIIEGGRFRDDGQRVAKLLRAVCAVLVLSTLLWVVVLLALPFGVGTGILGDSWPGARSVLVAMGASYVLNGLIAGPIVGLRISQHAVPSLRARLQLFPMALTFPMVGAVLRGASGFALGSAASSFAGVGVWWYHYRRARGLPAPGGRLGAEYAPEA